MRAHHPIGRRTTAPTADVRAPAALPTCDSHTLWTPPAFCHSPSAPPALSRPPAVSRANSSSDRATPGTVRSATPPHPSRADHPNTAANPHLQRVAAQRGPIKCDQRRRMASRTSSPSRGVDHDGVTEPAQPLLQPQVPKHQPCQPLRHIRHTRRAPRRASVSTTTSSPETRRPLLDTILRITPVTRHLGGWKGWALLSASRTNQSTSRSRNQRGPRTSASIARRRSASFR